MLFADRVPIVNTHSKMRRPKRVLPIPGSTLSALRRHVLANSFKLQTPSSFPGLTSLNRSGFDANQSIALRCRRVGAVHSIRSGGDNRGRAASHVRFTPKDGVIGLPAYG